MKFINPFVSGFCIAAALVAFGAGNVSLGFFSVALAILNAAVFFARLV
ncbi:MAG: hypothetical protein RB191_10970 [Terriglobia bacterium]|nr:hypothetical protein [Terriglobia bacterium]